jgi:pimeloyl-ACP methyl ester carboxylesterase
MYTEKSLPILGLYGREISNTFFKQEETAREITVIFPGYNYTTNMPLLYYASHLMLNRRSDVLLVETHYGRQPEFANMTEEEQELWVFTDAEAAWEQAWKQGLYERITLISKSMGGLAAAYLAASDPRMSDVACVFLTPLLTNETFRTYVAQADQPSLFITGNADRYYSAHYLRVLEDETRGDHLVLEHANHSLELKNDLFGSVRLLERVINKMNDFLNNARIL